MKAFEQVHESELEESVNVKTLCYMPYPNTERW